MRKDIFIDNNIAVRFPNPLDPEYKRLIKWLFFYNENDLDNNAYLVVSKKLLIEYISSCGFSTSSTNITVIINKMKREDRLITISKDEISEFKRKYYKKRIVRSLRCNHKDRNHIPVVLLSDRKFALTCDNNFLYDLVNFPGFEVSAAKRPQDIPYDS